MRKLIWLAVIIALLSFVNSVEASVGYKKDGVYQGAVADVNIDGFAEETDRILTIFASGHRSGVTQNVSTASNLTSAALAYGVMDMRAGSAKSIALANGVPGQAIGSIVELTS